MQMTMIKRVIFSTILTAGTAMIYGCGGSDDPADTGGDSATGTSALPEGLYLDSAPEGAKSIADLKASAEEGDEVVVRVVVGGREKPVVDGRASTIVVDAGLNNLCLAEDDHCPTPWDYCCAPEDELNASMATLQVVDNKGKVLATAFGEKVTPLSTLVVRGIVGPRPNDQLLTINATGIYVQPATP